MTKQFVSYHGDFGHKWLIDPPTYGGRIVTGGGVAFPSQHTHEGPAEVLTEKRSLLTKLMAAHEANPGAIGLPVEVSPDVEYTRAMGARRNRDKKARREGRNAKYSMGAW